MKWRILVERQGAVLEEVVEALEARIEHEGVLTFYKADVIGPINAKKMYKAYKNWQYCEEVFK